MPPAARLGDPTAHGAPLAGPCSPNVLIGGVPAWRGLSDFSACPVASPTPHGGGVVVDGSTSVLINGLPAARMGDKIQEANMTNAIVAGCPTVQIG